MLYVVVLGPVFVVLLVLAVGAWSSMRWRVVSSASALVVSAALVLTFGLHALVVVVIPMAVAAVTLPFHVRDLRVQQSSPTTAN